MLATVAACAPLKSGPGGHPRIMLVGDSIGYEVSGPLRLYFGAGGQALDTAAQSGCSIVRGYVTEFDGTALPVSATCDSAAWNIHEEHLRNFRPDIVIWLGIIETFPRVVDGGFYVPGPWTVPPGVTAGAAGDLKLLELIEEKRGQFESKGARLVFLTMPPPLDTRDDRPQRVAHVNNLLKQYVRDHPQAGLVDFAAMACPPAGQPSCPVTVDGIELRPDKFHFSPQGTIWAAQKIMPAVLAS